MGMREGDQLLLFASSCSCMRNGSSKTHFHRFFLAVIKEGFRRSSSSTSSKNEEDFQHTFFLSFYNTHYLVRIASLSQASCDRSLLFAVIRSRFWSTYLGWRVSRAFAIAGSNPKGLV